MKELIGKNIKMYRMRAGMTQEQLAVVLQISRQAVSRWEAGITMPDTTLFPKIAAVLHVSTDMLFGIVPVEDSEYVRAALEKIKTAEENTDLETAEHICRESLAIAPKDFSLRLKLAIILKTRFLITEENTGHMLEESIKLSQEVLEGSDIPVLKHKAAKNMAIALSYLGEESAAKEMVKSVVRDLDPVELYICHGMEKIRVCEEDIRQYIAMIEKRLRIISKAYAFMGETEKSKQYAALKVTFVMGEKN